jgi:bacterioferritin (cytochrome b1)
MKGDPRIIDILNDVLTGELTHILVDSEGHVDWLESQLELVSQMGEAHYLAEQVRD